MTCDDGVVLKGLSVKRLRLNAQGSLAVGDGADFQP